MKKNTIFALLTLLPTLAFSGIRLPYVCHDNGWLTIVAHGSGKSVAIYCVLPEGNYYNVYDLENRVKSNREFSDYIGIYPTKEQIEQAKKDIQSEGYTELQEIEPKTK